MNQEGLPVDAYSHEATEIDGLNHDEDQVNNLKKKYRGSLEQSNRSRLGSGLRFDSDWERSY